MRICYFISTLMNPYITCCYSFFQDVMVVGEPSLMGGEFGDEDERLITRLENTQYDAANSLDHDNHGFHGADSPMPGSNSWDRGPNVGPPQGATPSNQDSDKKSPAVSQ